TLAVFSVMGFSFSGAASNQGIIFTRLKPFDQRRGADHSAQAMLGRVTGRLLSIPGAIVVPFSPPSIPGLSRFGGFEFQVLDQTGADINALAGAAYAIMGAANRDPKLRGVFTAFTANDPQLQVTIDRQKALGGRAARNGNAGHAHAAGRHDLRVVRHLARGNEGRQPVDRDLRAGAAARLPHARRAVRKPGAAIHRPARRAAGGPRRAVGAVD